MDYSKLQIGDTYWEEETDKNGNVIEVEYEVKEVKENSVAAQPTGNTK